MKRLATTLTVLLTLCLAAGAARAITLTGDETDFPPASLVEDDGGDTQLFDCGFGPTDNPLDIGRVYCTIDNNVLYIGVQYQRFCFCDIQLGLALDVRAGGNSNDPFNRQIIWGTNGSPLPDYVVYDVIPTSCNGYNYEVIYQADGVGGWSSLGDGSNYWNFVDADGFGAGYGFKEFAIPLITLGVDCFSDIRFEAWVTQDDFGSGTKPAFDFAFSDVYPTMQKSQAGGPTIFDVNDGDESLPEYWSPLKTYNDCPTPAVQSTWGAIKSLYR